MAALIGELSLRSADFRRLWADHDLKECAYGVKRIQHPVAGLRSGLRCWEVERDHDHDRGH